MARDRAWAWPVAVAVLVGGVVGGVIWARAAGYEPPGAENDRRLRDALEQMAEDMRNAANADFDALPEDLTTLPMSNRWIFAAFERCGSVSLDGFEGPWRDPEDRAGFADPTVADGRLRMGRPLRAELCPVHVRERSEGRLEAIAVHHEDVHDPGDAALAYLRLAREGDRLRVSWGMRPDELDPPVLELVRR